PAWFTSAIHEAHCSYLGGVDGGGAACPSQAEGSEHAAHFSRDRIQTGMAGAREGDSRACADELRAVADAAENPAQRQGFRPRRARRLLGREGLFRNLSRFFPGGESLSSAG